MLTKPLNLPWKVLTNWYITLFCTSKLDLVIFQELLLIHGAYSWFQGWSQYVILITALDLSYKVHTTWYITILCRTNIDNYRFGHHSLTLPDTWRIFLTPRMICISIFDHIIGLSNKVHTHWYITFLCSLKIYKSKSGYHSGPLPDPWSISYIFHPSL